LNDSEHGDPRIAAIPDVHGHAKGEHKPFAEERPIPLSARMLFLWFFHACKRGSPRFLMVSDHMNYLTFEDPAAVNLVRRALKLAQAGDLYGAAETAGVDVGHAAVVSEGLRRGMRYSIGAEVDNDPRARPDAQNIVDAMKPDGIIRSVHFLTIDHPTHGAGWNWPFDNPEFGALYEHVGLEKTWELYMTTLIDAIERLPGNIVGHFYVPAIFGHWPDDATLEAYEDRLLDACLAREMAVEFNTRFLYRESSAEEKAKYIAANTRLLRKAKERGVGIAVGADAHSPKDQGHAFELVLAILDQLEINELVFPIGGRLLRVALRVVKEPEPPAPEPPPTPEPVKPVRKARTSESPKERPVAETSAKPEATTKRRPTASKPKPAEQADDAHAREPAIAEPSPDAETPPAKPAAKAKNPAVKGAPSDGLGSVGAAIEPAANVAVDRLETAPKTVTKSAPATSVAPAKAAAAPKATPVKAPPKIPLKKVAPPKVAPPKVAPPKVAPPKVAPPKVAPPKVAPPKVAPPKVAPPKVAPPKVAPVKAQAKAVAVKAAPKKAPPAKPTPKNVLAKPASKAKPVAKAKPVVKAKPAPSKSKPKGKPVKAKPKASPPKRTAAKAAPKKAAKPPARKSVAKKPAKKAPARPARPAAKKPAAKKPAAKKTTTKRSR